MTQDSPIVQKLLAQRQKFIAIGMLAEAKETEHRLRMFGHVVETASVQPPQETADVVVRKRRRRVSGDADN